MVISVGNHHVLIILVDCLCCLFFSLVNFAVWIREYLYGFFMLVNLRAGEQIYNSDGRVSVSKCILFIRFSGLAMLASVLIKDLIFVIFLASSFTLRLSRRMPSVLRGSSCFLFPKVTGYIFLFFLHDVWFFFPIFAAP